MSRKFQCKAIPSTWLEHNGRRLDCGPYLSGALEARGLLRQLPVTKEPLRKLTTGIYHAGRESRLWVESPEHGIPFMGSTDILASDMSNLPLISKKQVEANPNFKIEKTWTLITRSGTIGRMAYARSDMDGLACSEHVMRVVPDDAKVKAGYVYAYLSSRFGVPLIVSGTYGSIIQSIEPHHIADLPVPRLGDVERRVHELVQQAADLRTEANKSLSQTTRSLEEEIGGGPVQWQYRQVQAFAVKAITLPSQVSRLDAFHHIGYVGEALEKAAVSLEEVQNHARALYPPYMKRIHVEEGGYEFLGGSDLMTLDQRSQNRLSARIQGIEKFIIQPSYVLFQCDGQRYGIFGIPVLANRNIIGKAVTQHAMRLIPHDPRDAGYLSVYLATGFGRRLLMRHSAGTSIPSLNEEGARKILVYWAEERRRHEISRIAEQAWENRARATELEDEARALVERTIEEGAR